MIGSTPSSLCLLLHYRRRRLPPPPPVLPPPPPPRSICLCSCPFFSFLLCPLLTPHVKIVPVPRVHVVLVVTLGSGPVDTSPHLLTPLRAAAAFLDTVIVFFLTFLFLLLLLLIIICLLTKKCLFGYAKELYRGNVDYVIAVIIVLLPLFLLRAVPIAVIVMDAIIVVLRLLI